MPLQETTQNPVGPITAGPLSSGPFQEFAGSSDLWLPPSGLISYVAATNSGAATSASSRATNVPAGVAINDVVIACLGQWQSGGPTPTITPPAGFAPAFFYTSGDGLAKNSVWWKRLTAVDAGTYTFTFNTAFFTTVQALAFRGAQLVGDPITGEWTTTRGTFGTFSPMSLSGISGGDAQIWTCYNDTSGVHTPPTGMTEVADVDCAASDYLILSAGSNAFTASGGSVASSSSAGAALLSLRAEVIAPTPPVGEFEGWGQAI